MTPFNDIKLGLMATANLHYTQDWCLLGFTCTGHYACEGLLLPLEEFVPC